MPILDIFKKKKPEKKKEKPEQKKAKPIEKPNGIKEEKPARKASLNDAGGPKTKVIKEARPRKIKEKKGLAFHVLKSPQITEKATNLSEKNQYVFKVWPETNKPQIKKAVEDLYDVDVLSVTIVNARPKKRRLGRISGWRPGYKKAMVRIKEGQKIEIMPR